MVNFFYSVIREQPDTSCDGYWCDRNVNMSIAFVILFVTIGIVVFYYRKK